jgi:polysaccharide export outer membrane protein
MRRLFVRPLLLQFSNKVFSILFALLIAWVLGFSAAAQNQPANPPEKTTAPQIFPSAVPTPSEPTTSKTPAESISNLRLGAGDLLDVNVYNVPELSTKSRVGNSGDVYLPLIDYVHLAGLTIEEAQALIEKRLSDGGFVKSPHVTLFVNEYTSQGANVLGEVTKPGVYQVMGEPRLVDLISAAGGFTDRAGKSITISHRNQDDKPVTVPLKRNSTEDAAANITVSPGDTILVHKADVVYAVGDVARPSGFLMDTENLTVLKVIALAGGTNRTAKLNSAKIIRKGPGGMTETPLELKKMLAAKAPDIPMQGDDILFVPSSLSKVIMGRTADVAQQAAAAVSIVALH